MNTETQSVSAKMLCLTAVLAAFVFIMTFVPQNPDSAGICSFGRCCHLFAGIVYRPAGSLFCCFDWFGVGRFNRRLSDLDYSNAHYQMGDGRSCILNCPAG